MSKRVFGMGGHVFSVSGYGSIMSGHVFRMCEMALVCQGMFLAWFCVLWVFLGTEACSHGTEVCSWRVLGMSPAQPWLSDPEDAPFLDPALRKRAVKVKHVKRREKKSDKKVGPDWEALGGYWELLVGTGGHWEGYWKSLVGTGRYWEALGVTGSHWEAYWELLEGFWWALGITGRATGVSWWEAGGAGAYWEGSWCDLGPTGNYWEVLSLTGRTTGIYWETLRLTGIYWEALGLAGRAPGMSAGWLPVLPGCCWC